jgi:amidase
MDLTELTATESLTALNKGEITSAALVEALLERINRINPALNAIITLDAEGARRQAAAADEARRRGEVLGRLHGLPMTIKDSFETAGMRTVSGYPPFKDRIPVQNAPPVASLRQSGAIVLGKTNLPTLASGIQTHNPVFGRTNNPWDLTRTPGGSSGGAGAAIAAGLTCLELGSDIGGSIRIPAHFCGVYGLKASGGRFSGKGHLSSPRPLSVPAGWEALLQLGSFGPLGRSVADLRLGFLALAGVDAGEAPPTLPLTGLRVAFSPDFGGAPLDEASRRSLTGLESRLRACGCQILPGPDLDYERAWYVSGVCLGAINTLFQSPWMRAGRRLISPLLSIAWGKHPLLRGIYAGLSLAPKQIQAVLRQRAELIAQLEGYLGGVDAWICPVFPTPAFTHRPPNAPIEVDNRQISQLLANLLHNVIFNVTGNPAVAIPIAESAQKLPIGVQLIGGMRGEMALLNAAEQIAALTDGFHPPHFQN